MELRVSGTNVLAEWIEIAGNDDVVSYVDFSAFKRKGNKVKMWSLGNFKTFQKSENEMYLSSVSRDEYDCKEKTIRQLDLYLYSGNMKIGNVVWSKTNIKTEATSIMPMTFIETLFKIACGKR